MTIPCIHFQSQRTQFEYDLEPNIVLNHFLSLDLNYRRMWRIFRAMDTQILTLCKF